MPSFISPRPLTPEAPAELRNPHMDQTSARVHVSVMPREVIEALEPQAGQTMVDGTLGAGGHTRLLAERVGPSGLVLSLDRDAEALAAAERNLAGLPVKLAQANFAELPELLKRLDISAVDGILLDLGLSSDQLADAVRGFSFETQGELDLRFDTSEGQPAWRMIAGLTAEELADLIFKFGEERHSRRIARAIVAARAERPIRTAEELARIVRRAVPPSADTRRIDPATRTFQALRIAVNDELNSLSRALASFPDCLKPGGRLAVISFHSLEDRIVKQAFRDDPRYDILTKKPLVPSDQEIHQNPRARSAKLRVAARADKPTPR